MRSGWAVASWARACFQLLVTCSWTRRPLAFLLFAGAPVSLALSVARWSSMLQIASHNSLMAATSLGK